MKKTTGIYLLTILVSWLVIVIFYVKVQSLQAQSMEYKTRYYKCSRDYRKHLAKCSFISRDRIKRRHGRYIILKRDWRQ